MCAMYAQLSAPIEPLVLPIPMLGDTLGSHMNAALAFAEANDPPSIFAATSGGTLIARAYGLEEPQYLGEGRDVAKLHPEYLAATFVPQMKRKFDPLLRAVWTHIWSRDVQYFTDQGLDKVHLPNMVKAGLVSFDVARDLSVTVAERAQEMVDSGVGTLNSWYAPKAFVPRFMLYALGFAFLNQAISVQSNELSAGYLSLVGTGFMLLSGELIIPFLLSRHMKKSGALVEIETGQQVLNGALAAFMRDFTRRGPAEPKKGPPRIGEELHEGG